MLFPLTFIAVTDNGGARLVPPQVPSESVPFFLATQIGKDVYQILSHVGSSRAHVEWWNGWWERSGNLIVDGSGLGEWWSRGMVAGESWRWNGSLAVAPNPICAYRFQGYL